MVTWLFSAPLARKLNYVDRPYRRYLPTKLCYFCYYGKPSKIEVPFWVKMYIPALGVIIWNPLGGFHRDKTPEVSSFIS